MDKILDSIKCGNCKNVLSSPVFLPCGDCICQKHTIDCNGPILCHKCGIEHPKTSNGYSFPPAKALAELIDAQIVSFDFGKEYKEAKQSCQNFADLIRQIENFIKDPFNFAYEAIQYFKNMVQLKGEEEILRISENMHRIIGKLDEYKVECKSSFASKSEYSTKMENFVVEKEEARRELNKWLSNLKKLKVNCREYERIKSESGKMVENFENKLNEIKVDFFPKLFGEFRAEIERDFGHFEIDPAFNFQFLIDSVIVKDFNMKSELFKLCGFRSSQKMNLLYRGSLHGFRASDFHSKCEKIPKTLTIIKSTSGNVFGGYTEVTWENCVESTKSDKCAFIFSLVNKENAPLKVKIANGNEANAIYTDPSYGPVFGDRTGNDIFIDNDSKSNNNYSEFGNNYIHPNYPSGSEKANNFLAGSMNFTVDEIEVFKLK